MITVNQKVIRTSHLLELVPIHTKDDNSKDIVNNCKHCHQMSSKNCSKHKIIAESTRQL